MKFKLKTLLLVSLFTILAMTSVVSLSSLNNCKPVWNIPIISSSLKNKLSTSASYENLWVYLMSEAPYSVAISANGTYIAAGGYSGFASRDVFLFNSTHNFLWSYDVGGTLGYINDVDISADGVYIAAADDTSDVVLLNRTDQEMWRNTTYDGYSIKISEDGNYVVAGDTNGQIMLYEILNENFIWSYDADDRVQDVDISENGKYFVTGDDNNNVTLFDKDSSTPIWNYTTNGDVLSVAMSADGRYIAASTDNVRIYFFENTSSTPVWDYGTAFDAVSVAISADGENIVFGYASGQIQLRNKTGLGWSYSTGAPIRSVDISADGQYIVTGNDNGDVYVFKNSSSSPIFKTSTMAGQDVLSVAINKNGSYFAAGAAQRVFFYSMKTSEEPPNPLILLLALQQPESNTIWIILGIGVTVIIVVIMVVVIKRKRK